MRERINATIAGGYVGLGLRPGHVKRANLGNNPVADVRAELNRNRLELFELGFISDWWRLDEHGRAVSVAHEEDLHRLKNELGARHMVAIAGPLSDGLAISAKRFGELCQRAATHNLSVALEFLPWTDIATLEQAWQLVEASGEPNAKIVLDTWHFFRGGSTLKMIDSVPAERIAVIQLSDGPSGPLADELDATYRLRQVPGGGEFPLLDLFDALAAKGVTAPIGVEVLSDTLRQVSPTEAATIAAAATERLLSQYA